MLGLLLFTSLPAVPCFSSNNTEPDDTIESDWKLGLTLSGGAARGIAHIGVLHIIDSLSIKVDYISGTSMGAIIGGMYASGYSAAQIEEMVLGTDWGALFSSDINLEYVHPSRRKESGRHILSMPFEDGNLKFETGAIEGQKLWEELSANFFHVSHIRDFDKLPIPFACVATNLETGEAVVLREGDLVTSIRASMSVPAVFTAIDLNDKKLIDGGVVKNFPVSVAIEMGADEVLGVNVSRGLRSADKLRTPIDVIYQMGFFSDARSFEENKNLANWFINMPLHGIGANDFDRAEDLIELGKQAAREHISYFLSIAEKQQIEEWERSQSSLLHQSYRVRSLEFRGLENTSSGLASQTLSIEVGEEINKWRISQAIQNLYATDMYEKVRIYAEGIEDEEVDMIVEFREKPFIRFSTAIGYNEILGVSIGGGVQIENLLIDNSFFRGNVLIGENPSFQSQKNVFLDYSRNYWGTVWFDGSMIKFPFDEYGQLVTYRRSLLNFGVGISGLWDTDSHWSANVGRRMQKLSQRNRGPVNLRGWTGGWEARTEWNKYTLDRHVFPTSGEEVFLRGSYYFGYRDNIEMSIQDIENGGLEDLGIAFNNYFEVRGRWNRFFPWSEELTQIVRMEAGIKFRYDHGFLHAYNIGGSYPVMDRQMAFMGLKEYTMLSPSFLSTQLGLQRALGNRFFATGVLQAAVVGFDPERPGSLKSDNFILGAGLSAGLLSRIGPIELTFSYSPYVKRLVGYINLGWNF